MIKSANGWPASADQEEIGIKSYLIPGTTRKVRCAEAVAPLLVNFAAEFDKLIEPIDEGEFDDWGYAFRKVRGSDSVVSNHSSGTAIDLNSIRHPLGKVGTFEPGKVPMIRALAMKYGLRWGGDYVSRPDPMHFEVKLNAVTAAALIDELNLPMPKVKGAK